MLIEREREMMRRKTKKRRRDIRKSRTDQMK